jgi:hypothetical protein
MKIEKPQYRSSTSVAQPKPIPIHISDKRLNKQNYGKTIARAGAPVIVVDMSSKNLVTYASNSAAANLQSPTPSPGSNPSGDQTLYPVITTTLPVITNLVASWQGKNLVLTFTLDTTIGTSSNFFGYQIQVYDGTIWWPFANKVVPSQSTGQVWTISSSDQINWTLSLPSTLLAQTGITNPTTATQIEIEPVDINFLTPGYTVATISGTYTTDLPAPIITIGNSTDSYIVTTTNFTTASAIADFNAEIIEEYVTLETNISNIPTAPGSPWVIVNQDAKRSPIGISAPDDAHRWVRARFQAQDGGFSNYSNYTEAQPTSFIPSNTYPPVMVSNVNSQWAANGLASSSGNDILVSYTQPNSNSIDTQHTAPTVIKVKLIPVINGTTSSQYSAYFYHTLISSSDSSFVISQQDLFNSFGNYYDSFVAYISVLSQAGVESTTNYQITAFTRSNTLNGITPIASISNVVDGYVVQFDLGSTGASYGEVYQFFTNPTWSTGDPPDYLDADYISWSNSNPNQIIVTGITAEGGNYTLPTGALPYAGYKVTGTSIPSNTYITSISGTGPNYTLSLNNNLTTSPSGNIHMQLLVYSGTGPANIFLNYYSTLYISVAYYDKYGKRSNDSIVYLATPINPTSTLITNAVQVAKTADPSKPAAIYMSSNNDPLSGSRILLGTSNDEAGIFVWGPSDSSPSTQIIGDNSSNLTFITKNAQIADWSITSSHIQNDLSTGTYATGYVGLSGSNTNYSFWAGALTSDNSDHSAKFSVTPSGKVTASNLSIVGNGISGSYLITAGSASNFSITQDGILTALQANISGSLNVTQSSNFSSNVNVAPTGVITAGASQTSGASVQIDYAGLKAYDANYNPTTKIYGNAIGTGATFWTQAAQIGGWNVNSTQISSSSNNIILDSSAETIQILSPGSSTYGVLISANPTSKNGIAIGNISGTNQPNATFSVSMGGVLKASGATIGGAVNITDHLQIGSKTAIGDYSNPGGYADSAGSFNFGNSTAYIQYDRTSSATNIWLTTTITAQSGNRAYQGRSQIVLGSGGTQIFGLPVQGNYTQYNTIYGGSAYTTVDSNEYNPGLGLGALGRQRMLVEDPYDGMTRLGMAVYYQDSNGQHSTNPVGSTGGADSGYVGDLWVVF